MHQFYLQALSCDHPSVVLEVVLGMESLITKLGATLQSTIWEKVLKILKSTAEFVSKYPTIKIVKNHFNDSLNNINIYFLDRNGANSVVMIADHLNETLTKIELLVATNTYGGNLDRIYDVIETFSLYRPVI